MSLGRHVTFKRFDTNSAEPDQFEVVGSVFEISGVEKTADTHEDTNYGASESDYRTYVHGLKDGGEIEVIITYKSGNTQADDMADAFDNSTLEKTQLVFPADIGQKVTMDTLVTKVGIPTAKGDVIRRGFTLKVSGEPLQEAV